MSDMPLDYAIYEIAAPYIILIIAFLLFVIFRRRGDKGALQLFWLVLWAAGYLVTNYLELMVRSETAKVLFAGMENVFVALIPVSWLRFVFDFVDQRDWNRLSRFWPFLLYPLLATALVFTNDSHRLFWQEVRFVPEGRALVMQVTHGSLYYVVMLLGYGILLAGILLIVLEFFRNHSMYRRQLSWIILGIAVSVLFNLVYVFRPFPGVKKDLTPIGFALGAVCFFVGIFRYRFLELAPAPRSRLFDAIRDGILVINGRRKIVDMNSAAMAILGIADPDLGSPVSKYGLLSPLLEKEDGDNEVEVDVCTGPGPDASHYAARLRPLYGKDTGRGVGVITLHDITERVRLFEEIRTLRGIVPICASCKKIRSDEGFWQSVESYVSARSYAEFSHGLCPECAHRLYPDLAQKPSGPPDPGPGPKS